MWSQIRHIRTSPDQKRRHSNATTVSKRWWLKTWNTKRDSPPRYKNLPRPRDTHRSLSRYHHFPRGSLPGRLGRPRPVSGHSLYWLAGTSNKGTQSLVLYVVGHRAAMPPETEYGNLAARRWGSLSAQTSRRVVNVPLWTANPACNPSGIDIEALRSTSLSLCQLVMPIPLEE